MRGDAKPLDQIRDETPPMTPWNDLQGHVCGHVFKPQSIGIGDNPHGQQNQHACHQEEREPDIHPVLDFCSSGNHPRSRFESHYTVETR